MRTVSRFRRSATLAALLTIVVVVRAYGDDPPSPIDPPEARIHPPIGIASEARIKPPGGEPSVAARIRPPGGVPQPDARIHPPIGATSEPSYFELMLEWLYARIKPPVG